MQAHLAYIQYCMHIISTCAWQGIALQSPQSLCIKIICMRHSRWVWT